MLKLNTVTDVRTGRSILELRCEREGRDTAHHYVTAMTWLLDSRHIIVHTDIDRGQKAGTVVRCDTATGDVLVLEEGRDWGRGIVSSDDILYLYHGNELYAIDAWSGERRTLCWLGESCTFYGPLSITNDGRTIGTYWTERRTDGPELESSAVAGVGASGQISRSPEAAAWSGAEWVVGLVDVASGAVREVIRPGFAEPYPIANHAMISPADPELLFFCHEGATEHIPDRLWMADARTGQARNIYSQKKDTSGRHVEYVGHEVWAYDGSGMYFVKYPHSPDKPTGVCFVDKNGEGARLVNGDYPYWHVGVSPDGRYAAADTQEPDVSKIVLIDIAGGRSELLCEMPCRGIHPGHPHPSFSPDSRKVTFTYADEQDVLCVGIIDIGKRE